MQKYSEEIVPEEISFEEKLFEDVNTGMPSIAWIQGIGCSEPFDKLTPLERKLLIKYYLEDCNDRQVAENLGMHINAVNARRRIAAEAVADLMGIDRSFIKRNRKSGRTVKIKKA